MIESGQLKRILEAALLASTQPLNLAQLGELFEDHERPANAELASAIEHLRVDSEGRGVTLVEVASGYRYQVAEDVFPWVCRLWAERQTRYSRALLETLALIAYRQPITRGDIEQIRGVAVSQSILRTLQEREWVRVVGHRDVPGRPALYGTTKSFLDYFNLASLDQLPTLSELRDIEDMEPELDLEPRPRAAANTPEPAASHTQENPAAPEHMQDESGPAADASDEDALLTVDPSPFQPDPAGEDPDFIADEATSPTTEEMPSEPDATPQDPQTQS